MKVFSRKKESLPIVQLRNSSAAPFGIAESLTRLSDGSYEEYSRIRATVPIVDAAVLKLIRLTGGFDVECADKRAEQELRQFVKTVDTGRGQRGLQSFLDRYLDSMITAGRAVGEIVIRNGRDVAAVICGDVRNIQVQEGESPLDFRLCTLSEGQIKPVSYPELILFTPFNPTEDSPYGVSMLKSMSYLTKILGSIYSSIGANFERAGNIRYAVVYKPQGDMLDRAYAKERVQQIAQQWSAAMQSGKNGSIRDFVTMGDVDIRVIGADNQFIDSEGPVRQILEQLVARTGIPPFMLGLTWSATERMSSQQADMMTSEITALRRTLTPVLERICDMWMRVHGYAADFSIVWDDINLQDEVEEARAELYRAQAENIGGEAD